jgi:hypothetical protein
LVISFVVSAAGCVPALVRLPSGIGSNLRSR